MPRIVIVTLRLVFDDLEDAERNELAAMADTPEADLPAVGDLDMGEVMEGVAESMVGPDFSHSLWDGTGNYARLSEAQVQEWHEQTEPAGAASQPSTEQTTGG